ncbi:hypothetical protein N0V90_009018 [Kalmusia sp. IMI 367209]|nr:hypothetical protein N0V90_009018 [Kalmusia sp. IMI 367209]
MAETIGLVASVIQVAGAGLKLSQTLYQYADSVASADRRIKDVAKEIQQLDAALKKSKKNTFGRLILPFRETKIELLRSHVDKLKSTLQLLMQVLTHAHQVAAQKLDREAEAAQREQIKALLQNKRDSTKRYEESLKNYSMSEDSTVLNDEEEEEDDNLVKTLSTTSTMMMTAAAVKSSITVKTLETCVQHIQGLLNDIETLQQALEQQHEGADNSEHHQSLIGSYIRARGHLDSVLLGGSEHMKDEMTGAVVQDKTQTQEPERIVMPSVPSSQIIIQDISVPHPRSHVQIPVDVLAASRVLDEKRKRNVGASARFRARRRTKEQEQLDTIARLKHELAEARRRKEVTAGRDTLEADRKLEMQLSMGKPFDEESGRAELEARKASERRTLLPEAEKAHRLREESVTKSFDLRAMIEEEAKRKARDEAAEARLKALKAEEERARAKMEADKKSEEAFQVEVAKRTARTVESFSIPPAAVNFKDALGRKFNFPFQLVKSWKDMEHLILGIFGQVDSLNRHVIAGQYDLIDETGCIIMPSTWEASIRPGAFIVMRFWPQLERSDPVPASTTLSSQTSGPAPGTSIVEIWTKEGVQRPYPTLPDMKHKRSRYKERKPSFEESRKDRLEYEYSLADRTAQQSPFPQTVPVVAMSDPSQKNTGLSNYTIRERERRPYGGIANRNELVTTDEIQVSPSMSLERKRRPYSRSPGRSSAEKPQMMADRIVGTANEVQEEDARGAWDSSLLRHQRQKAMQSLSSNLENHSREGVETIDMRPPPQSRDTEYEVLLNAENNRANDGFDNDLIYKEMLDRLAGIDSDENGDEESDEMMEYQLHRFDTIGYSLPSVSRKEKDESEKEVDDLLREWTTLM